MSDRCSVDAIIPAAPSYVVATRSALKQTPGIEASAMFVDGRNRTAFILALLTLPACMYFVPGSLLNQGLEVQQIIAHAAHTDKIKMSFRTAATELPAIDLLPYNTKPPPGSFCVSRDFLRKECASANYCAEHEPEVEENATSGGDGISSEGCKMLWFAGFHEENSATKKGRGTKTCIRPPSTRQY